MSSGPRKTQGIFVTGTDTGVGKTIVSATLARLIAETGISVGVMKPVTSGCVVRDGRLVSEDIELLKWACQSSASNEDSAPYLLKEPIAPSEAASREGVRINFQTITDAYERLAAHHDFVIVEGAGGLMVPLAGGLLVADLINSLSLPALVVARPGLGTVNHTLLTTYSARQMGITVKGVIIGNYPAIPDLAEQSAPHMIGSLSGAPLLGVFPAVASDDQYEIVEQLVATLQQEQSTRILLRELGCRLG
jgi:dethiobiotin synthetase